MPRALIRPGDTVEVTWPWAPERGHYGKVKAIKNIDQIVVTFEKNNWSTFRLCDLTVIQRTS